MRPANQFGPEPVATRPIDVEAGLRTRPTTTEEQEEGLVAFCRGAERLSGKPIGVGSAGYAFQVLPRIHLAAVYWLGDEELSAQASILFEDTACHYMPTDGLAILGSHLTNAIVKAARERRCHP